MRNESLNINIIDNGLSLCTIFKKDSEAQELVHNTASDYVHLTSHVHEIEDNGYDYGNKVLFIAMNIPSIEQSLKNEEFKKSFLKLWNSYSSLPYISADGRLFLYAMPDTSKPLIGYIEKNGDRCYYFKNVVMIELDVENPDINWQLNNNSDLLTGDELEFVVSYTTRHYWYKLALNKDNAEKGNLQNTNLPNSKYYRCNYSVFTFNDCTIPNEYKNVPFNGLLKDSSGGWCLNKKYDIVKQISSDAIKNNTIKNNVDHIGTTGYSNCIYQEDEDLSDGGSLTVHICKPLVQGNILSAAFNLDNRKMTFADIDFGFKHKIDMSMLKLTSKALYFLNDKDKSNAINSSRLLSFEKKITTDGIVMPDLTKVVFDKESDNIFVSESIDSKTINAISEINIFK